MNDAAKSKALEIGERLAREWYKESRYPLPPDIVGGFAAKIINAMEADLDQKAPYAPPPRK